MQILGIALSVAKEFKQFGSSKEARGDAYRGGAPNRFDRRFIQTRKLRNSIWFVARIIFRRNFYVFSCCNVGGKLSFIKVNPNNKEKAFVTFHKFSNGNRTIEYYRNEDKTLCMIEVGPQSPEASRL